MAQKFRYFIDKGAGYVQTDLKANTLKLNISKSINKSYKIQTLSGGFEFFGQDAEDVYDNRTTNYLLPFKIEEFNGLTWQTLHECHVDILGEYKRLSRVLSVNKFKEFETPESKVIAELNTTYKTTNFVRSSVNQTYTSIRLDILGEPTALDKDAYKDAFDIEGNATASQESRWQYFEWQSTIGISPNLQHIYTANKFDSKPQKNGTTNGYDQIIYNGDFIWVKIAAFPWVVDTWNDVILYNGFKISFLLDRIMKGIDGTFEFDDADYGDENFDSVNTYLGDGNEYEPANIQGISFNLKKLVDFWLNFYNAGWYMDGTKLKFRDDPYNYFNTALDWSIETANIDETDSIDNLPDLELWRFDDDSIDRFLLSYFAKGVPTNDNTISYSSGMVHNIPVLRNGGASRGKLVYLIDGGSFPDVKTPAELFELFGKFRCYSEPVPASVPVDPLASYTPIVGHENRPIYSMKHNKFINDYVAFDLFSQITVSGGNAGILDRYIIDIAGSGEAEFTILFSTFTT